MWLYQGCAPYRIYAIGSGASDFGRTDGRGLGMPRLGLDQAQPAEDALASEIFDREGKDEPNHGGPAIHAFSVVIKTKFWGRKFGGNGGFG